MELKFNNLGESNSFLNIVLNNMNSALFMADKEMRITNFNDEFCSVFKKEEKDILNNYCGNVMGCMFAVAENVDCGKSSACDKCPLRNTIIKSFEDKEHIKKVEMSREVFIQDERVEKYFSMSTKYISYNDKENVLVILDDVTDYIIARRRLEELNDIKTKYMSILAHDLRTPLTSIIGFSDLVFYEKYSKNSEILQKLFQQINKSGNYMLDLVNDLLDITTIENGRLELKRTKLKYVNFASEVVTTLKHFSKKREIRLTFNSEVEEFTISIDENRIRRVMENLIGNAVKFSPEGSTIHINLRKDTDGVITEIMDEGPGVDEEYIESIFHPYVKTGVVPKNGEKGTGLGLSISKSIVEKHYGEIGIDNSYKNGAKFYFKLPVNWKPN